MLNKQDAETVLIASILLNQEIPVSTWTHILPEHISQQHRELYTMMYQIAIQNQHPTWNVIIQHFDLNKLENIVNTAKRIAISLPDENDIKEYTDLITKKYYYEEIIRMAEAAKSDAIAEKHEPEEIASKLNDSLRFCSNVSDVIRIDSAYTKINKFPGHLYKMPFINIPIFFSSGQMILLSGKTSVGKTSFWMNWIYREASERNKRCLIFDYELGLNHLLRKFLSIASNCDGEKIKVMFYTDRERFYSEYKNHIEYVSSLPIHINQSYFDTRLDIIRKCRNLTMQLGSIDYIVIDYAQIVPSPKIDGDNPAQQISTLSRDLKLLAEELDAVVILVSQLSREADKSATPKMSHLKESSGLEQHGDSVIILYRDENIDISSIEKYEVTVDVQKNRDGSTGRYKLMYYPKSQRFLAIQTQKIENNNNEEDIE